LEQLEGIWRVLRPGGVYICVTPNRLNGPHDVSKHYDLIATGFHLKEYTVAELSRLFQRVGFRKIRALLGPRGACIPAPVRLVMAGEAVLKLVPPKARRVLGLTLPCRAFLGIRLLGMK
jgi:SAM-dependent methyltransferase